MTENKPYGYAFFSTWSGKDAFSFTKPDPAVARDYAPLFKHPPVPQPDPDPAVEAARRKALRAIFGVLDRAQGESDTNATLISHGLLRDLVGQPRKNPEQYVKGYDPEPLPASVIGPAGTPGPSYFEGATIPYGPQYGLRPVGVVTQAPPARLSADELIQIIADAARVRPQFGNIITYGRIALAVHEAVYGKDA